MKNNMTSKLFEAASSVNKGAYELSREALVESQRIVEEKSDEEIRKQLKGSKFCPRCGRRYNDYPAISRYDNKTEICPDCGVEEAMINFTGGHLEDPHVYDGETGEEINESAELTAKVTYHDEDGTRDYIAGKLSDGRYFFIYSQEEIIVSDKDLPSLAKKDMTDFRYDEDGDKDFIEALENGTELDKDSDLAKIIIKASRKYLDDGGYLLSESANNISTEDKKKEIEDRIAELKLALEDEAISEDEKEDVKKEISDLENSLNECSSKENLNEDDSDDEDDDEDDSDDLDDNKEDKSLLDSDNYQDVIQFLINDENEAIDGYNKAKDRLSNLLSEDEYAKYLEVIEHIISEENEHIEELTKVLNGEPVDLNHDKESSEDLSDEITESSPIDSLDKDVMTDIEYIVKSFKEDGKSDEDILDEIKSRINDLDDGVLEDIMSSELYSFMKDNEEGKDVDFDSLISRMSDIFEEEYEEEEE